MESQWKRIEKPQQLKAVDLRYKPKYFGLQRDFIWPSRKQLAKSFISRPKQLQGFTGFKTEIQVRNVLNFLSWTVYIWNNFRL